MIVRGRARKFGDNIDTDTITSGSLLHLGTEELAQHAFEPIAPDFAKSVREGDIIVGGNNFGCGSSQGAGDRRGQTAGHPLRCS